MNNRKSSTNQKSKHEAPFSLVSLSLSEWMRFFFLGALWMIELFEELLELVLHAGETGFVIGNGDTGLFDFVEDGENIGSVFCAVGTVCK